jgi:formiminotetrahydrofolate cyclodeaminase
MQDWFRRLASEAPAPGGGAAAALEAALGAALVSMVCNLTTGRPRYEQHAELVSRSLARSAELLDEAMGLVEEDARAFGAVSAAYRLPKGSAGEQAARTASIQRALVHAAEVPLRTAAIATEVTRLAADLLGRSNANVVSDLGVAASSAMAALEAAAINVEVNLAMLEDRAVRNDLAGRLAGHRETAGLASETIRLVRERIAG